MTDGAEMKNYFVWVETQGKGFATWMQADSPEVVVKAYARYHSVLTNGAVPFLFREDIIAVCEVGSDSVSRFFFTTDEQRLPVIKRGERMEGRVLKFPACANYRGELQAKEQHGRFYWRVYCELDEVRWAEIPPELWAALKKYHDDTAAQRVE